MAVPKPGQLGFGLPARDNQLVDAFRDIRDIRGEMSGLWAAMNAATPTLQEAYQYTNNLSFPNDSAFHLYSTAVLRVPPNCALGTFFVIGSAGTSWSGSAGTTGGFSVQVAMAVNGTWTTAPGSTSGFLTNYGSLESSYSSSITAAPGATVQFGVNVSASQTSISGDGWAQVSGVVIWTKS